jgi:hypothetical protein
MKEREHPPDIVLGASRGIRGAVGKRPRSPTSLAKSHPTATGKILIRAFSQDGRHGHTDFSRQPKSVGLDGDRMLAARLHHDLGTIYQSSADHNGCTPRHVRPDVRRLAEPPRDDTTRRKLCLRQLGQLTSPRAA